MGGILSFVLFFYLCCNDWIKNFMGAGKVTIPILMCMTIIGSLSSIAFLIIVFIYAKWWYFLVMILLSTILTSMISSVTLLLLGKNVGRVVLGILGIIIVPISSILMFVKFFV